MRGTEKKNKNVTIDYFGNVCVEVVLAAYGCARRDLVVDDNCLYRLVVDRRRLELPTEDEEGEEIVWIVVAVDDEDFFSLRRFV